MFIAVALSAGLVAQYRSRRPFAGYALGVGAGVFLRELVRAIAVRFFD